jgi:tRNA(fMet)-specific endonuclease VapC
LSLRFLLDTNIVSEPLRPRPAPGVLRRLERHDGAIAISAPVWHELRFGCERLPPSRRRTAIEEYLEAVVGPSLPVLDYDRAAADWHAAERARLVASGRTPSFVDGQIAAIARVNDLVLVTTNREDFLRFRGLQVQSWI